MKLSAITTHSFRSLQQQVSRSPLYRHPSAFLWRQSLSIHSDFCRSVVRNGYLSWEQMVSAASRYCLGASLQQGVIFWQIDREGRVHDGKLMYYGDDGHRLKDPQHHPLWASTLLARRSGGKRPGDASSHCLFGLHLLGHTLQRHTHTFRCEKCTDSTDYFSHSPILDSNKSVSSVSSVVKKSSVVCIVEAEKSAVILSEKFPQYVWLATGGLGEVQPDKFRALRGHQVILFPDTDTDGTAYRRWYDAAEVVMRQPFWGDSPPIRVSPLLERHATREQKARKIDLVDYLME